MSDTTDFQELRKEATKLLRRAEPHDFLAVGQGNFRSASGAGSQLDPKVEDALRKGAGPALFDLRDGRFTMRSRQWAYNFATLFFTEIRDAICRDEKAHSVEGLTARGAASAVAGWAVSALGLSNPIAFGVATLIVLVLGSALRSAFCTATQEEILVIAQPS